MNHRGGSICILLILFLILASQLRAVGEPIPLGESSEPGLSERLELPQLVKLAFERNPKIKAAYSEWQAAAEKLPQITSLPDPMFMYGYFIRRVETRVGPQRQRFGISQPFPYPGTLDAAGAVQLKQIQIEEEKYEQTVRDVIVDMKLSYHELSYIDRAIDIVGQNQEILDHIVKLASNRYSQDAATYTDVLKAQSQLAQLSYDLVLLLELREVEQANIRSLLSISPDVPLGNPAPVPYITLETTVEELSQTALSKRQEIQMAELMSQKAEKAIELAKKKNRPMTNLELMTIDTGGALMPDVPDSGKNPWLISLGLSMPIWRGRNASRVREAELNHQTAIQNRQAMEVSLLANLRKVYFRMQNARRLVELYENSLIPQAEKAMEIAETWNQEGEPKSIAGLLETQSVWLNFNLARARAIADYQQGLTKLEQLVGGSLAAEQEGLSR